MTRKETQRKKVVAQTPRKESDETRAIKVVYD